MRECEGEPVDECDDNGGDGDEDDDDECGWRATVTNDYATEAAEILAGAAAAKVNTLTASATRRAVKEPPPPHVNFPRTLRPAKRYAHYGMLFGCALSLYPPDCGGWLIVPVPCSRRGCPRLSRSRLTRGRVPSDGVYQAPPLR